MVIFELCCRGVQALEESKLDLHNGFLVVQEMLTHWAQIVSYLGNTGQQQEYQLDHGSVSDWSLILRCDLNFVFVVFKLFVLGASV